MAKTKPEDEDEDQSRRFIADAKALIGEENLDEGAREFDALTAKVLPAKKREKPG